MNDIATDNRAPACVVIVDEHRKSRGVRPRARIVENQVSLESRPAEIRATGIGKRQEIDLLAAILSYVCDRNACAIEREAPGIAQSVGEDLVEPGLIDERI